MQYKNGQLKNVPTLHWLYYNMVTRKLVANWQNLVGFAPKIPIIATYKLIIVDVQICIHQIICMRCGAHIQIDMIVYLFIVYQF